jgi:hypothetical protein
MNNRNGIPILDATRGSVTVARQPHKLEAAGSIPASATTAPAPCEVSPPVLPAQRPIERQFHITCSWIGCKLGGCYPWANRHWCGEHLDVVIVREHRGPVPEYLSTHEVAA